MLGRRSRYRGIGQPLYDGTKPHKGFVQGAVDLCDVGFHRFSSVI
jgi:hypothetical protein